MVGAGCHDGEEVLVEAAAAFPNAYLAADELCLAVVLLVGAGCHDGEEVLVEAAAAFPDAALAAVELCLAVGAPGNL